jgi:hypothetical protein
MGESGREMVRRKLLYKHLRGEAEALESVCNDNDVRGKFPHEHLLIVGQNS